MAIENGSDDGFTELLDVSMSDPGSEAKSGSGGGDMDIWSAADATQVDRLANRTFTNNSGYTLPSGFGTVTFDSLPNIGMSDADSTSKSGDGGGDMDIWSSSDDTQLDRLANRTFTNNASYDLPAGIASVTFDELAPLSMASPGEGAEAGTGGGQMDVFTEDASVITSRLTNRDFTNISSFKMPAGISSNTFDEVANVEMGTHLKGNALDADGNQTEGTARLTYNGEALAAQSVSGYFKVSFGPPASALQGEDGTAPLIPDYGADFAPEGDALATVYDSIPYPGQQNIQAAYGRVSGRVTDVEGSAVGGVNVGAGDIKVPTDSNGYYSIQVPGNKSVTLTAIEGKATKDVVLSPQEEQTVDFQYAGVSVTVTYPDGTPAKSIPVTLDITGETERTGTAGTALFRAVPPNSSGIVGIFGVLERSVDTLSGGQKSKLNEDVGVGFSGRVVSIEGLPVRSTDVRVRDADGNEFLGGVDTDGNFSTGAPTTGVLTLVVAKDDRRFATTEKVYDVKKSQTLNLEVVVERRKNTSNAI